MASLRLFSIKISNLNLIKQYSTKTATGNRSLVDKVVLAQDGKMFVAWHPTPDFPYELTQPIPKYETQEKSSVIKEAAISTAMKAFKTKHPEIARLELSKLTFTTKHKWFPRARDKKAKNTPMDREYL